ncbi:MAG: hypothetical protein AB3N16_15305 [Flavobacteriaceae bacterium]
MLSFSVDLSAQVKIGDNPQTLHQASVLELESTDKVLVINRLTDAQMNAVTPLQGALAYNTDQACIFYYNGTRWINLCSGAQTVTFEDNGDGTYKLTIEGTEPVTFDGAAETVTTMVDNNDGSYTYTNENGTETVIEVSGGSDIVGTEGSIFFAGSDGAPTEDNEKLFWDQGNERLRVGSPNPNLDPNFVTPPNSTLHTKSFATNIKYSGGYIVLGEEDHTVIFTAGSTAAQLPHPNTAHGRMYILKKPAGTTIQLPSFQYYDSNGQLQSVWTTPNVLWLQSDGYLWQQVN